MNEDMLIGKNQGLKSQEDRVNYREEEALMSSAKLAELKKSKFSGVKEDWFDLIPKGAYYYVVNLPKMVEGQEDGQIFKKENNTFGYGYVVHWNGSYHDAQYDPKLVAWARGNRKFKNARRMKEEALSWYEEQKKKDISVARFEARRQVRSGD